MGFGVFRTFPHAAREQQVEHVAPPEEVTARTFRRCMLGEWQTDGTYTLFAFR